jgi:CubicO group peptidase (beta-lactamase class C family)
LRVVGSVLAGLLIAGLVDLSIARPVGGPGTLAEVAAAPSALATPAASQIPAATPAPTPPDQAGTARPPVLAPLDAAQAAALEAAVARARAAYGLDALAVGVSYGGARRWTGASGLARDGITPLTGDSPFGIASITKTFVASEILQLVDEGTIRLTDPVAALLPDVSVPAGITVQRLLDHTSGLADLFGPLRDDLNANPDRIWTTDEVLARVPAPWFAPGANWGYSNTNYLLLGLVVERVTGR